MSNIDTRKTNFLAAIHRVCGLPDTIEAAVYSRDDCNAALTSANVHGEECYKVLPAWLVQDPTRRAGRGLYRIPEMFSEMTNLSESSEKILETSDSQDTISTMSNSTYNLVASMPEVSLVPSKNDTFVPWGHYDDINAILASKQFAPVYVTGMSGNGKTTMIEQVCAASGRECIRVNITAETDEDDLIGGFRLINGETKFVFGGVVQAMQRGAILLLDEIDLGTERMMCLQPVLEGKGIFIKKIGVFVKPAPGFNVVATANTKGQGDTSGKYVGTNGMNEAFLERFGVTLEQSYAPAATERKILEKKMAAIGLAADSTFAANLVQWADTTRKTYEAGGSDSLISTRRLVNVVELYGIFKDKAKAVTLAIARFDRETKEAFWNLWTKIDADAVPAADPKAAAAAAAGAGTAKSNDPNACPF